MDWLNRQLSSLINSYNHNLVERWVVHNKHTTFQLIRSIHEINLWGWINSMASITAHIISVNSYDVVHHNNCLCKGMPRKTSSEEHFTLQKVHSTALKPLNLWYINFIKHSHVEDTCKIPLPEWAHLGSLAKCVLMLCFGTTDSSSARYKKF